MSAPGPAIREGAIGFMAARQWARRPGTAVAQGRFAAVNGTGPALIGSFALRSMLCAACRQAPPPRRIRILREHHPGGVRMNVEVAAPPRSRAARLRRHTVALARAAHDVLQSRGGLDAAFDALAPIAMETLGLQRLALWQSIDGTLKCVQAVGDARLPAQ